MKRCPNPDCPHKRRHGEANEFRDDVKACTDCGAELHRATPEAAKPTTNTHPPLTRVIVTLATLAALLGLEHVVLPGIDKDLLESLLDQTTGTFALRRLFLEDAVARFSLLSLGLQPIETASAFVGFIAMLVPPWRRLLFSGPSSRAALLGPIALATLAVATLQAAPFVTYLVETEVIGDSTLVPDGNAARPLLVASLLLGVALAGLGAWAITRFGLGHGFALIPGVPLTYELLRSMWRAWSPPEGYPPPEPLAIALPLLVIAASAWVLRRPPSDPVRSAFGSAVPVSGVLTVASALLALASLLDVGAVLREDIRLYSGAWLVGALLLGAVALPIALPRARFKRLASQAGDPDPSSSLSRVTQQSIVRSVVLLSAVTLTPLVLDAEFGTWLPFQLSLLPVVVALSLDLADEWRFRSAHSDTVDAWPLHELVALGPVHAAFAAKGIPLHAKGWRFRSLFQFLAPNAELSLVVPKSRAPEALDTLRTLLAPTPATGPGVTQQSK